MSTDTTTPKADAADDKNEIVVCETRPSPLLQGESPEYVKGEITSMMANATAIAQELAAFIRDHRLSMKLGGRKDHVLAEGWAILAKFMNRTPTILQVAYEEHGGVWGYVATAGLIDPETGEVVSQAQCSCFSDEENWQYKPRFSLMSMAETRAVGKVCRLSFSWVMELAGYATTPAEELEGAAGARGTPPPPSPQPVVRY